MLAIKRELLLEWTYANDNSVFTEEQLSEISKHVINDSEEYMIIREFWKFIIYNKLDVMVPYIISVDVAGGLDNDYTAISFIHPKTLKVDASFRNKTINPTELSMVLLDLGTNYFPYTAFVIENNSYGRVVITNLLYSKISSRIFYYIPEKEKDIKTSKAKNKDNKIYGIPTTTKSRAEMINDLLPMIVNDEPEVITCPFIFSDIRNLERKKNGKIEHRDKQHDDNLFSYLLGRWALGFAKHTNLNSIIMRSGYDEETQEKNKS